MKTNDLIEDIQALVHGPIEDAGCDDEREKPRLSCSGTGRLGRNFTMTHLFTDPARFTGN